MCKVGTYVEVDCEKLIITCPVALSGFHGDHVSHIGTLSIKEDVPDIVSSFVAPEPSPSGIFAVSLTNILDLEHYIRVH